MNLINGTATSNILREELKAEIGDILLKNNLPAPTLSVILVGDDMASKIYIAGKVKACAAVGIKVDCFTLDEDTSQKQLNSVIKKLNSNTAVDGILLQLPLPKHLNSSEAINLISPEKDVDGLTNINLGKVIVGDPSGLVSCTPQGILTLLNKYNVSVEGKNVVVIGRSILVGKPMAMLLTNKNATVTLCHSHTKNLTEITKSSDIIICAVGRRNFVTKDMVKPGAVIVDVGINRNDEGKVCGDVDFVSVKNIAGFITPVPGGVGPMTITTLLQNVLKSYKLKNKL